MQIFNQPIMWQQLNAYNHAEMVKRLSCFRPNVRMGKKCDLSDFDCGMIVGARQAGLSISETADLLGFLHTTVSSLVRMVQKTKSIQWATVLWTKTHC